MKNLQYILAAILITSLLCCGGLWADGDSLVRIVSPAPGESVFGKKTLEISWESMLGEGFKYAVSFSSDGEVFDTLIAEGIEDTKCEWQPKGRIGTSGKIKVKMMEPGGFLIDEAISDIAFVPYDAIVISKANQRLYRFSGGKLKYSFICSTALPAYDGTEGEYKVYLRKVNHWSTKYSVWMPHALFYHKGYAIHATKVTRLLGRPASHGCIRLRAADAKKLFNDSSMGTRVIVLPKSVNTAHFTKSAPSQSS